MSETMADSPQADILNGPAATDSLRPFIQQTSLKTMQLGQLVLDLYAQEQLTHTAIMPLCDELLALEKTMSTTSSARPAETETAVPLPDPIAPSLPPETPVAPAPENPPAPTHCPQCHTELAPGKKFCTTCGLPLASMGIPDTPKVTAVETAVNLTTPPAPPEIINLCPICGTLLQPDAAFCTHCGHPLGGRQLAGQPIAQTGAPIVTTLPHLQTGVDTIPPSPLLPPAAPTGPVAQFCQNCGKGLPADIAVCPDCGGTEFDSI